MSARRMRGPGWAALVGLGVLALAGGPAGAVDRAAAEAEIRRVVDEAIAALHVKPERVGRERIVEGALAQARAGTPVRLVYDWVNQEITADLYAFAKPFAIHDPRARYALPFDVATPRMCVQGAGGKLSHTGPEYHAWDFSMPLGTPVLAAREGTVALVLDGYTEAGATRTAHGNTVVVLHADGTFAIYTHLSPGIPIAEGTAVAAGQEIAKSGNTGYSRGPHLHFHVARVVGRGKLESLPLQFGTGRRTFRPQAGMYYGSPRAQPATCLADAKKASPQGSAEYVTFMNAFTPLMCQLSAMQGYPLFTGAADAGGGTLRVTATPEWLSMLEQDRELQLASLVLMWRKANGEGPVRVEMLDAAGQVVMVQGHEAK